MLSERPYLRGEYPRETTSVVTWLICAVAGSFLLEFVAVTAWGAPAAAAFRQLAFSAENLAAGWLWTPLTHWLLHSTGNLFHVSLVLAGLYLLGHELIPVLGARRFLLVFAIAIFSGALVWGSLNWRTGGTLIGATAGIYGLIAVHALLHADREHSILLFFFFPITFKPGHLALGLLGFDTVAMVIVDLLGRQLPFSYAPSAHLGGMLAGWACCRLIQHRDRRTSAMKSLPASTAPSQAGQRAKEAFVEDTAGPGGRSRDEIRQQVDRILDKINSQGFGALSPAERRILDEAKELLSKR